MNSSLSKLFPIDRYTYETGHGRYRATIVGQLTEIWDTQTAQEIEIEFQNVDFDFCPVRRVTLSISPDDLKRDSESLFCRIMQWVFAEPSAKNYFELELNFAGSAALSKEPLIEKVVAAR